jgi:hypothetical protein
MQTPKRNSWKFNTEKAANTFVREMGDLIWDVSIKRSNNDYVVWYTQLSYD